MRKRNVLVRWVASLVLTAVLASAALSPSVWVGISYYAASRQVSPAATAGIGALGVYASVLHGAAWSFALGGPAGLVAGAAAGL